MVPSSEKKTGKYRLINTVIEINRITLKDTNLPFSINKFLEEFAGYIYFLLIDFFSRYDQIEFY
jgi:hypothetical protein